MDATSREMSMCVYYGFECRQITCATAQMTRRTWSCMCNQFDNLLFTPNTVYYLGTGSLEEGTFLYSNTEPENDILNSDVDKMLIFTEFKVYPIGYNGYYDFMPEFSLQMKRSEHTRPGYCLVEVVGGSLIYNNMDLNSYIKDEQQKIKEYFVREMKQYKTKSLKETEIKGPSVKYVSYLIDNEASGQGSHDHVIAIEGKQWPAECRYWSQLITWPSVTLQEAIRREGFHIVKVGHPLSPETDKEWRLSFSVAEKMLIHSFNPTQLKCAVVMKMLLNYYIKPKVPDSINSYHIKTLMLWSVEQDIDQKWEPQYFIECLTKLLTNLMECISLGKLQHYFITDNNLFECKVTKDNKEILFQEVEALQSSVCGKCISLLGINEMNIFPLLYPANLFQKLSLERNTFRLFSETKSIVSINFLNSIGASMNHVLWKCLKGSYKSQYQLYISLEKLTWSCFIPNSHKEVYFRLSNKRLSYFKTWFGSMLTALFNPNQTDIGTDGLNINQKRMIADIGSCFLTESYEDASTTGCIRMALVHMYEGNHYHAIPLLNRALNIIDQFDDFSLYKEDQFTLEDNFTEYMHLYNDQQEIECALMTELLNDKVLHEIPFTWLEMDLLPRLLQLELTRTIYRVDILKLLDNSEKKYNLFQYWNPIPLTHFLLFICYSELLKSVTFLDPACLQDDIDNLQYLITHRQRLRQDEVPPVLNLLSWCYLEMGERKFAVKCVQQSTGCDKTMFSHTLIQHVIDTVIKQHVRCNVSDRKLPVFHRYKRPEVITPAKMDARELSMCVYYGFGCYEDTCATAQMARRTLHSQCIDLHYVVYKHEGHYLLGTGSAFEGTSLLKTYPGNVVGRSSVGLMDLCPNFQVYPISYDGDYDLDKPCLQMKVSENTKPGYCLVDWVGVKDIYFHSFMRRQQKELQNSARYNDNKITTIKTFTNDLFTNNAVFCFASKNWPVECRRWPDLITWPSVTLQQAIKRKGFHIVRVGHPSSPGRDSEWRMSFSVAEKMLIESFNPTQLTCAVVMKWLMNHYIKPLAPDSITSYHVKTLMLWSVEQDTDQKWEPQYFIQCLKQILTNMIRCISVGKLEHYFIPDNNLFEGKITTDNKEILYQKVEALQLSIVEECITLLGIVGISISSSRLPTYCIQGNSMKNIAFRVFCECKIDLKNSILQYMYNLMKHIVDYCMKDTSVNNIQFNMLLVCRILKVFPLKGTKLYNTQISEKYMSYFKTWFGSVLVAFYFSNQKKRRMEANDNIKHSYVNKSRWEKMFAFSLYLLTESNENASTTGCIKMALQCIYLHQHYRAIPLLNRALNIIDQFDDYSVYNGHEHEGPPMKYNFTEYMHLYNDQEAIGSELQSDILNDKVLCETPFIWLEMSLLPSLLQLELTHTIYKVDLIDKLNQCNTKDPFQIWNPIPLTHFLLFVSHYELLKSVTFLDPGSLLEDVDNLQYLINDRQRLRQDEVPSLLNLLTWCFMKLGHTKLKVKFAVQTVQQSTGCDKTLFSHLFIQHIIGSVIGKGGRCIVS